jgi:hypothetical protein
MGTMMAKRLSLVCATGGNDGFREVCEKRMREEEAITTTSFCFSRSPYDGTSDV